MAVSHRGRSDHEVLLDEVVSDYMDAAQAGSAPAPAEVIRAHPAIEAELREFFEAHRHLGDVMRSMRAPDGMRPSLRAATRTFGEYHLEEILGRGGMGVVYRARQPRLGRTVALKTVVAGSMAAPDAARRFEREARLSAGLDHPGIVPIYEVGEIDGVRYFTMKLIAGGDLAGALRSSEGGRLGHPRAAAELVEAVARAVHHAHENGVVHRDLKPANILLDADGRPWVTDFGLARAATGGEELTHTGALLGTPMYIAPEVARGDRVEPRPTMDVYSLGVILYELLTGERPFRGDSSLDILRAIQEAPPVRPRAISADVPRDLETIVLQCLEKEPVRRYPTAAALGDDLERFLSGRPIAARRTSALGRTWRWCRRNPTLTAVLGLLVVIAVGTTSAAMALHRSKDDLREALWLASYNQARFARRGVQHGRRFESLRALRAAAAIRPSMAIRNEAAAALALVDVEPDRLLGNGAFAVTVDARLEREAFVENGDIVVRDVGSDLEIGRIAAHARGDAHLELSGRFVAEFSHPHNSRPGDLRVWDLEATGMPRRHIEGKVFRGAVAFAPRSSRLAIGGLGPVVRLVDLEGDRPDQLLFFVAARVQLLRWSPTEDRVAAVVRGRKLELVIVDSATNRIIWKRAFGKIHDVALHADGVHVAVGSRDSLSVWSTDTGERVLECATPSQATGVAFNAAGTMVGATSWDATFRLWRFPGGRELVHGRANHALRFAPDGRSLVARSKHGRGTRLWRLEEGLECMVFDAAAETNAPVAPFACGGGVLLVPHHSGVALEDLRARRRIGWLGPERTGRSVLVAPDESFVITWAKTLDLWPMRRVPAADGSGATLEFGARQPLGITNVRYAPDVNLSLDGRTLAVVHDWDRGLGTIIDLAGERPRRTIRHPMLYRVAVSPCGRFVAGADRHGPHRAVIWDARSTAKLEQFETGLNARVAFSPDGRWLAISTSEGCTLRRTGSWEVAWRIERDSAVELEDPVAFSPDGSQLAMTHRTRSVRLVSVATGEALVTLEPPDAGAVLGLAFDPTASRLAVFSRGRVHVWDLWLVRRQLEALGLDWPAPRIEARAERGEAVIGVESVE